MKNRIRSFIARFLPERKTVSARSVVRKGDTVERKTLVEGKQAFEAK